MIRNIQIILLSLITIEINNNNTNTLIPKYYLTQNINNENNTMYFKIKEKIKKYNKNSNDKHIKKLYEVIKYFKLTNNEKELDYLIGQILLESAFRHKINNKVIESYMGAVGICQILPRTCLWFLSEKLYKYNVNQLHKLGMSNFEHILNEKNHNKKLYLTKQWLSNPNNNIIMWGIIMSYELNRKNLIESLITYNAGHYGLIKFKQNNKDLTKHKYIMGIKERIKSFN